MSLIMMIVVQTTGRVALPALDRDLSVRRIIG